jgi:hypothetical protein
MITTTATRAPMLGAHCAQGLGGRDCACCGQKPGKVRRRFRQAQRRRERQAFRAEVAR